MDGNLLHEGGVHLQDIWGCFLSGGVKLPTTRYMKAKCNKSPQIFLLGCLMLVSESEQRRMSQCDTVNNSCQLCDIFGPGYQNSCWA